MLQVSLHDRIFQACIDRGIQHGRMAVAQTMDSNAHDEVQFDTPVAKFHPWPISQAARYVGEIGSSSARIGQPSQRVGVFRSVLLTPRTNSRDLLRMVAERCQEKFFGLGYAWIVEEFL